MATDDEREAIARAKARLRLRNRQRQDGGNEALKQRVREQAAKDWEAREANKDPWYEDLAEGAVTAGMETYYGAKDLFGGEVTEEDRARIADWRSDALESGWGVGGRVLGEAAMLAAPGGAAAGGARALATRAPALAGRLRSAAQAAGSLKGGAALAAAHGGVRLPEEGEDVFWEGDARVFNALKSGASALALGGALEAAARGVAKASPYARALRDKGVELLPSMQSDSGLVRVPEFFASWFPGLAKGVEELRDEAVTSFNRAVLKEAAPPRAKNLFTGNKAPVGTEAQATLRRQWNKAYEDAWGKVTSFDAAPVLNKLKWQLDFVTPESAPVLKRAIAGVETAMKKGRPQAVDEAVRKAQTALGRRRDVDVEAIDFMGNVRDAFRNTLNKEGREALGELAPHYAKYVSVKQTGEATPVLKSELGMGVFTPSQLLTGAKQARSKRLVREGTAPLQDMAEAGLQTIESRALPAPLVNLQRGLAKGVWSPTGLVRSGGRSLMGQTAAQRQAQRLLDAARAAGVNPGAIAGATWEGD